MSEALSRRTIAIAIIILVLFSITIALLGRFLLQRKERDSAPVAKVKPNAKMVKGIYGEEKDKYLIPELAEIPAGNFTMGSADDQTNVAERPQHQVKLNKFLISRFEITNAQYLVFCQAASHQPTDDPRWPGRYLVDYPNHPAVRVRWQDAVDYCQWLSQLLGKEVRLPTEAEWEYAAQGSLPGTTEQYSKDMLLPTTEVGSNPANPMGLYDMLGNVSEWCQDWYGASYYVQSPTENPTGPESGEYRVMRGGSWASKPEDCRVTQRIQAKPDGNSPTVGFRVVVIEK